VIAEGDDALSRSRQVGDDEADTRVKLIEVPLTFATTLRDFFQLCA
jgi:hypothetical protein